MPNRQRTTNDNNETTERTPEVKVVAEMPQDAEIREQLEEMEENDGYPPLCR
ncbi:hypothetical protein ACFSL6_22015 [Paenibacillus thailandensis]|uniref:Uncharacterized protein n=1 Tax=Paenibacillus thailandensis TaxID=393250 RepID=A0ABW5R4B3_9BACL